MDSWAMSWKLQILLFSGSRVMSCVANTEIIFASSFLRIGLSISAFMTVDIVVMPCSYAHWYASFNSWLYGESVMSPGSAGGAA